jgi:uncharacterized membrane protein YebE (DUF533 family)
MKVHGLLDSANRAWAAAKTMKQKASGEKKATAAGAVAGGAVAATFLPHVGIAAFGGAIAGATVLPVALVVGGGAVAGYAAFKAYKDWDGKRTKRTYETSQSAVAGAEDPKK